jgi:hypothetical protein
MDFHGYFFLDIGFACFEFIGVNPWVCVAKVL